MKRIVVFLMVFSLMFHVLPFPSSAATPYEQAGEFLKEFSILKGDADGDLKPFHDLTREESLAILLRMLNEEKNALAFTPSADFKDVPGDHWAIRYISYAKAKGLTKGISAQMFGLKQNVTTKQFTTFMLRALNYSADWSKEDIMKKAQDLGLLKGSVAKENEKIKRGEAFIIMKNTLNTRMNNQKMTLLEELKKAVGLSSQKSREVSQTADSAQKSQTLKLNRDQNNGVNLDLNAFYANVELHLLKEGSDILIEYRPDAYELKTSDADNGFEIKILGFKGYRPGKLPDETPVKIYVPTAAREDVKMTLTTSVLKADKVFQSGNIDLESIDSNVYLELLDEFKGRIKINAVMGNVDLVSQDGFKDAVFQVFAPYGVVNLPQPPKDPSKNRKFVHVNLSTSFDTTINVK